MKVVRYFHHVLVALYAAILLLQVPSSAHTASKDAYDEAHLYDDNNIISMIEKKMDALDASNQALKKQIEWIKQSNEELMHVQNLLLQKKEKRALLLLLAQENEVPEQQEIEHDDGGRSLLSQSYVTWKDFTKFNKSVEASTANLTTAVTNTASVLTDVQNKSEILEIQANETNQEVMTFEIEVQDVCDSLAGPLLCTPEIHFASDGQFVCNPEHMYYSKSSVLCQGDFPTRIVLAGVKSCVPTIERVDFVLTLPNQSTVSSTDNTWPYIVFNQDPSKHANLTSGSYFLNYTIHSNRASCISWSGSFAFEVNGTNNCSATEDQPLLYKGHLYEFGPKNATWNQCQALAAASQTCCNNKIGHMVTITDSLENDFVYSALSRCRPYGDDIWMGANDVAAEGNFTWITNEPWIYENWQSGQPNNGNGTREEDCVYLRGESNKWADYPCDVVDKEDNCMFEWDCF